MKLPPDVLLALEVRLVELVEALGDRLGELDCRPLRERLRPRVWIANSIP